MKKIKFIYLILLLIAINTNTFSQSTSEITVPIVSFSLNKQTANSIQITDRDSIVESINGKAIYFSNENRKSEVLTNTSKKDFSSLWSEKDFSVEVWVQTKAKNNNFQVIATNKDWNSGEIKDFTDNRYFGFSRTSGVNKGWAIICQPDGSWAWNIGNGKHNGIEVRVESFRKDYRPTAPRQQINDGEWHHIAFTISRKNNEARLYFDGQNVAIYYMGPVKDLDSGLPIALANDPISSMNNSTFEGAIDGFKVYDHVLSSEYIATSYRKLVPAAKLPEVSIHKVENLNLMTWNIWHGGRRHGRDIGPQQVIDFITDTNTDIVMMQETYGSGPLIADALGYYFYLSSANISVISKYPIEETKVAYHELWSGITTIRLSKNQQINLVSIWLHYLPGWGREFSKPNATEDKLIAGEGKTRHKEIKVILNKLENEINVSDSIPLIIGGDFNSPSHKDWVEKTSKWHNNLIVEWPVSKTMEVAGFNDSFREINPNLNYASPTISDKNLSFRIDYIYYKGADIKATDSDMHFKYKGIWPSDHPAVTTTFKLD